MPNRRTSRKRKKRMAAKTVCVVLDKIYAAIEITPNDLSVLVKTTEFQKTSVEEYLNTSIARHVQSLASAERYKIKTNKIESTNGTSNANNIIYPQSYIKTLMNKVSETIKNGNISI